jgi:ABC-type transport system involved in multi-copper enzyme maturation permease subunit
VTPWLALAGPFARPALRDLVLPSIVAFAVAAASLTPIVAGLAIGGRHKAIRDVALGLAWLLGSLVATLLGVRAVGSDLKNGTAIVLLYGPLSRGGYVAGRYLGVLVAVTFEVASLAAVYVAVTAANGVAPAGALVGLFTLLWFELAVVSALAMLLASVVSQVPAALMTAGLWAAGHLADEYASLLTSRSAPVPHMLFDVLYAVVPDLDLFDVQDRVVHQLPIDPASVAWACAYGASWVVGLLALTAIAMMRRDL